MGPKLTPVNNVVTSVNQIRQGPFEQEQQNNLQALVK